MLITIGAMIGAGKTSLAELVAEHFNSEVFYESVIQHQKRKSKRNVIRFYYNYGF